MGPLSIPKERSYYLTFLGWEEVSADLREILGHRVRHGGVGIPYHWLLAEHAYSTSKAASKLLVG